MSEITTPNEPSIQERESLRLVTHVMYALHMASWFSAGFFSVIAMIINYIKRPDLPDEFFRSHFRWQSRSFWFTLLWLLLSSPLFLFFWIPGAVAWTLVSVWYLYRFIRGWWSFVENKPMPTPAN